MADLRHLNFDASQEEPNEGFDPVPSGWYLCVVSDSEMKKTKAGTGEYLKLTFEIIEGEYKGRKLWAQLNLDNPNAQAVQIARGELSALCRAIGVLVPKDSCELHDRPLLVKAKLVKRQDTGEMKNEVGGYKPREEGQPARPAANAQQKQPAQQPANTTPPWRR